MLEVSFFLVEALQPWGRWMLPLKKGLWSLKLKKKFSKKFYCNYCKELQGWAFICLSWSFQYLSEGILVPRLLESPVWCPCVVLWLKATALSVFFQLRNLYIRDLLIILRNRVSSYWAPSPARGPFEFGSVCLCIHLPVTLFCQD